MIENAGPARRQTSPADALKYWGPPLIWMSAIFFFSTDNFSGENTGSLLHKITGILYPGISRELFDSIHFLIRKAGHFTEYAILALLLFRAFRSGVGARWRWSWALISLLIVIVYALSDEYHQSFTRNRTPSIYDSMTDTYGAVTALFFLWIFRGRPRKRQDR
jgi:VanZ family protein